jgi:LPXTG-site transpeptidase (sortase) family protein
MQINLDRMRQLSPKNDKRYLFINIASFEVVVMEYDQKKLIIPAIVGKLFRKTPSFRSELNQIVINPTWKVPHRIAAEDLLPIIQEDPDYLVRQNYQVFNSWSDKAKPLNIQKIEWKKLDKEHFPYRIAAHRWKWLPASKKSFYDIDKVKVDDVITMQWNGKTYSYKVSKISTVTPDKVDILQNSEKPKLTLFSCAPLFSSKYRLVVEADLMAT